MKPIWLLSVLAAALVANPAWGDSYVPAVRQGAGTPITSLPRNITQPGLYYLTGNLSTDIMMFAITIEVDDVTLDLRGFSLSGPLSRSGYGIIIDYGLKNVEVRHGQIKNFDTGVWSRASGRNHRLADLKVSGCSTGIRGDADGVIITRCQASGNSTGILSSSPSGVVDQNIASSNTWWGFSLLTFKGVVTNNFAASNGTGFVFGGNPGQLVDRNVSAGNTSENWSGLTGCTTGLNTP